MKNTGERLRAKREELKLSVSEAALVTKINPKILNAIEAGEGDNLPAETFLKGFIRSYASFLKLDPEEIMRVFYEEMAPPPAPESEEELGVWEPGASPTVGLPPPVSLTQSPAQSTADVVHGESSGRLRFVAAGVIVVLIGLIIGVRELVEKYQKEQVVETPVNVTPLPEVAKPEVTSPPEEKKDDIVKAEPEKVAEIEKPAEPEKSVEPPKPAVEPPPVESSVKAETKPVPVQVAKENSAPQKVPEPAKKPEPPKQAEPKVEAPAVVQALPPKPEEPSPTAKAKYEIILEALDKIDLKVQLGGQTKRLALAPMQVHTLRTSSGITIDVSDGGAVNVIVNGRDRGVPGDLGKPKQIKIP